MSGYYRWQRLNTAICRLLGHTWAFYGNLPTDGPWWWEYSRCKCCGRSKRELVAGPRG